MSSRVLPHSALPRNQRDSGSTTIATAPSSPSFGPLSWPPPSLRVLLPRMARYRVDSRGRVRHSHSSGHNDLEGSDPVETEALAAPFSPPARHRRLMARRRQRSSPTFVGHGPVSRAPDLAKSRHAAARPHRTTPPESVEPLLGTGSSGLGDAHHLMWSRRPPGGIVAIVGWHHAAKASWIVSPSGAGPLSLDPAG